MREAHTDKTLYQDTKKKSQIEKSNLTHKVTRKIRIKQNLKSVGGKKIIKSEQK